MFSCVGFQHILASNDKIAKEALKKEQVEINTSMGKGEIKAKIKCEIMQIWQK